MEAKEKQSRSCTPPLQSVAEVYPGSWAVVTGASSGVGEEVARDLALHGRSLILIGRSVDRLETLAHELEGTHGISVVIIKADLSAHPNLNKAIGEAHECLREVLVRTRPTILCINHDVAGLSVFGQRFLSAGQRPDKIIGEEALHLNTLLIVDAFLNARRSGAKGRRLITLVSSANEYFPSIFIGTYHPRKVLLATLGRCVYADNDDVDVTVVTPGLIRGTRFFEGTLEEVRGLEQTEEERHNLDLSEMDKSVFGTTAAYPKGGVTTKTVAKKICYTRGTGCYGGYRSLSVGFDGHLFSLLRGILTPGRRLATALFGLITRLSVTPKKTQKKPNKE